MKLEKKVELCISIIILFGAGVSQTGLGFSTKDLQSSLGKENVRNGNILYVGGSGPGNYSTIQDAVDSASDGDTIFVYSGVYYENIQIQKTINLIGQDKTTTIIDGNKTGIIVNITADDVNITGFTIQNSGTKSFSGGIITFANNTGIVNNIVINNSLGILFFPFILQQEQNYRNSFSQENFNHKDFSTFTSKILELGNTSNHNTVIQNIISNNMMGVILYYSSNNVIVSNSFLQNIYGLVLFYGSNSNLISNNTFINDGLMVYNDTSSNLIINNTINNKPLFYLEEQSNMVITGDFGQIILVQCHNITIKNQEITNTFLGIELIETTHCSLCQNTVESNYMAGILLLKSSNNIITGNTIYANYQGIMAWGDDNMFSNNTITFNNQSGLSLSHCLNTTIVGNVISNNDRGIEGGSYSTYTIKDNTISENAYGLMIYGHTESYNLITDNNIYFNTQCGIKFNNVGNTILLNNSITSNNKGIYADYSENIIFLNNTISYQQTGIILSDSTNNIFSGNIVASNVKGIDFSDSDQNSISGKNFITNNTNGMILWYSNSNIISNNILENNEASGIEFSESSKNIISGNTFFWDHDVLGDNEAINLYDSTDTIISDNTIIKPTLGIVMTDSSYNSIRRNHISECISQAIQCSSGSNNDICGNFLTENGIGINVSYTYNNKIEENVVIHTANTGIDLSWSSDNAINKNNISLNTNGVIIRYSSTHNVLKENVIRGNYETGITLMTDAAFNTIIDNVILKNTLGINSSGYQNIFDNNDISLNTNGVIVGNSSTNNILKENTIGENQKTGIILLTDAAFNTIIDNEILKNTQGITISGNHNTINHNMISENTYGINISYGSNNFICCNNFLANKHQAGFKVLFTHRNNRWNNNYWNQSRILPQPIFGKIGWRNPGFSFPWVSFDWHPARKPYEIL